MNTLFQHIPAMDQCLDALFRACPTWEALPRPLVREAVTAFWDICRASIREGQITNENELNLKAQFSALRNFVEKMLRPRLRRVINASGVVIHTNLGRSLFSSEALAAVTLAASGYCNLEMDMHTGERGSRHDLVEQLLCQLTGAEAALVVNNNAAAVLLTLDTLCQGGEVVLSRGELVEIGGSFRIPEIMEKSRATLKEVGTTNRTHLRDYVQAINENTKALMRVHTSNYRIIGFHKAVPLEELAALGREKGLPVIEDLGSGSLLDFTQYGLVSEPTVQDTVRAGADIVTFSGDKVLGGPQAGIIVGRKDLIKALRQNPLTRALRQDKLSLAALEATLRLYLDPALAKKHIPTLSMLTVTPQALSEKAQHLESMLRPLLTDTAQISLREDVSRVGGGAFPEQDLPTTLVCVVPTHLHLATLRQRLLEDYPPLIGRMEKDAFCLDPRTLLEEELTLAAHSIAKALATTHEEL